MQGGDLSEAHPGVVFDAGVRRRGQAIRLASTAIGVGLSAGAMGIGVGAMMNGNFSAHGDFKGSEIPLWALAPLGLVALGMLAWDFHGDGGTRGPGTLVRMIPFPGGVYLEGSYKATKGMRVPVTDASQLSIELVCTRRLAFGALSLYGLRFTSTHGRVLMPFDLRPEAFDLSGVLGELARRSVSVTVDAAIQHDAQAAGLDIPAQPPQLSPSAATSPWPLSHTGAIVDPRLLAAASHPQPQAALPPPPEPPAQAAYPPQPHPPSRPSTRERAALPRGWDPS